MNSSDPDTPLSPPWGPHELGPGDDRTMRLGPLELQLRRVGEEVWIARRWTDDSLTGEVEEGGTSAVPVGGDPVEPEWSRWAVPQDTGGVRLEPVFPDRPLVVEPEQTFHLVRGARVRVYVRVPLWVSVGLPAPSEVSLVDIPTHILSDTWFGDFAEGELAYALPTSARREITPEIFATHRVICPLVLGNDAVDQLEVKKLCLRVAHLSVFARGGELWSDETRVRYQGEDQESQIRISGKMPSEAPDAVRVKPPRVPLARGFRARTFARLADLSGFGASP
ncbi:MAG: hypothetical protein R3223_02125 [Longimicrobiales bacterium]|nr:hypothetical protein [Longimicrobiales bacterium]